MADAITSPQNPRIKAAARLRDARARIETGLILIDGVRELARAVDTGIQIVELFACGEHLNEEGRRLCNGLTMRGAAVFETAPSALAKLAYGERNEGVVAVARRPAATLADLALRGDSLVAVVDGVEKPGNLGAILRTADAAGLDAVIAADAATDVYGPNVIRASLGAAFTVPLVAATTAATRDFLEGCRVRMIAAAPDAPRLYTDVDYRGAVAIVLGSEAAGLSPAWSGDAVTRVSLPMRGRVDSLNVSATAAVLFYEAVRQRSVTGSAGQSGDGRPDGSR